MNYIAYYRVSTKRQGDSGLGLDAQQTAVHRFIKEEDKLLAEYSEVESGTNRKRKELWKAIYDCKKQDATLIIAKLDRLARDVEFTHTLKNSGLKFIALDNPEANPLTIGLLALMAEEDNRVRSERIAAALKEIKNKIDNGIPHYSKVSGKRVYKLGNEQNFKEEYRLRAVEATKQKAKDNTNNKRATAYIISQLVQDYNMAQITRSLNDSGFKTSRGKRFTVTQVQRLIDRYNSKNN